MGFLHNITPDWIDELYLLWRQSPGELSSEWRAFFEGFELAGAGQEPLSLDENLKQSAV
jgi:2-oxoglutarate dehydrogenase E1 component